MDSVVVVTLVQWTLWAVSTFAWNSVNSANSRSKNTASWWYNAVTTLCVSAFYLASMLLVGNILLASRSRTQDFVVAVALYSLLSACGSVVGQQWALRFEKAHHIHHG
jgi:hypothetical protein